jgi:hypothetical protein
MKSTTVCFNIPCSRACALTRVTHFHTGDFLSQRRSYWGVRKGYMFDGAEVSSDTVHPPPPNAGVLYIDRSGLTHRPKQ